MRYTAFCIVDDLTASEGIIAHLSRAGFTDAEIARTSSPSHHAAGTTGDDTMTRLPADAPRHAFGAGSVVGATLGLIAGLSAYAMPATGKVDGARGQEAIMEGPATVAVPQAPHVSAAAQERIRTIAYHLCPGRSLISVLTDNTYEIETILEIFRDGGAIYCEHIADDVVAHEQPATPSFTALVHTPQQHPE
jgi:hypothetical protein